MIKIEKDKILINTDMKEPDEIGDYDLPKYLGDTLEIGEGVTFGRIFDLILKNGEIFNIVFNSFTHGFDIFQYMRDLKKVTNIEDDREIEYLEVYRVFEHMVFRKGDENYEYYYGIHGIGYEDEKGDRINYSLMFLSLSELRDLPIKTNDELNITIDNGLNIRDENVKFEDKYIHLHTAKIPITLFNFIGAILHEITFTGYPENRDEKSKELEEQVKEIDEKIARGEEFGHEMLWDENDEPYFLIDGERKYLLDDDDDEDE